MAAINPLPTEVSPETIDNIRQAQIPTPRDSLGLSEASKLEKDEETGLAQSSESYYPDGGRQAWTVVFGAWILCASTLGFGLVWGIFSQYYIDYVYPDTSPTILQFIGGLYSFVSTGTAFLAGRAGERHGYKRMIAIGSTSFITCLFISAFTYQYLVAVFIVQSVGLGVSTGITLPLIMAIPSQWFKRNRALATGVTTSASGIGGGISTLLLRVLLRDVGPRNTFLIFASIQVVTIGCGLYLVRLRDVPENRLPPTWLPTGIWHNLSWYSLCVGVFVAPFGFLSPFYLITGYTQEFVPGLDGRSYAAAVPVLVMNVVSGLGRILAGLIADRIGPLNTMMLSFTLGGLFQMALWPFVRSFGSITAFAAVEGLVVSWFISLMAPVSSSLFGSYGIATTVGALMMINAPGQLLGNTISTAILQNTNRKWYAATTFSGGMMLLAAFALIPARVKNQKRLFGKI